MPEDIPVDVVLDFLSEWKTTDEVREKFGFSNSQWFHFKRWLLKGKYIETCKGNYLIKGQHNKVFMYRRL